jgi:hypothetical protein
VQIVDGVETEIWRTGTGWIKAPIQIDSFLNAAANLGKARRRGRLPARRMVAPCKVL